MRRGGQIELADGGDQLRRQPLIGIQAQHPVMAGKLQTEVFLRAVPQIGLTEDPGAGSFGQGNGLVLAIGVDHDDFTADLAQGVDAGLDIVRFVESDDDAGDLLHKDLHPATARRDWRGGSFGCHGARWRPVYPFCRRDVSTAWGHQGNYWAGKWACTNRSKVSRTACGWIRVIAWSSLSRLRQGSSASGRPLWASISG